jgi:hypothetical protein
MFKTRYARPRGRSHITHIVSTYVLSSPEGSENLALSPHGGTRGSEGDARVGGPPLHLY